MKKIKSPLMASLTHNHHQCFGLKSVIFYSRCTRAHVARSREVSEGRRHRGQSWRGGGGHSGLTRPTRMLSPFNLCHGVCEMHCLLK